MTTEHRQLLMDAAGHLRLEESLKSDLKKDGRALLRELLETSGLSLRKFAARLDLSPSYISHILAGHGEVTIELAARLNQYRNTL